jgi:hypothetical protein
MLRQRGGGAGGRVAGSGDTRLEQFIHQRSVIDPAARGVASLEEERQAHPDATLLDQVRDLVGSRLWQRDIIEPRHAEL